MPIKHVLTDYGVLPQIGILAYDNIRKTPERISELATNLDLHGQQVPIIVTPAVDLPGKYYLLDGWRRWLAAREAGIKVLKAVICQTPPSAAELRLPQLSLALHHSKPSDFDLSVACLELLELNPTWDQKDVAAQLGLTEAVVSAYCSARKASPAVHEAYQAGEISAFDLRQIVRAGDQQDELLAQRKAGLTRDQVVIKQARSKKPEGPTVRLNRIRLALPNVEFMVSGEDIDVSELIEHLTSLLKEAKRAQQQSLDIKTLASVLRDRARSECAS